MQPRRVATKQFNVRVPDEWRYRAEQIANDLRAEGVDASASQILKSAIPHGLEALEAKRARAHR